VKKTKKKKNFSSFKLADAFKQLNLTDLRSWDLEFEPIEPSAFLQERLHRMRCFDLQSYEESKKLVIDAICEEALQGFETLRMWKGGKLEGEETSGYVDYLLAERRRYLEAPMLCVVEAKKDDFEQGLAQCLVEMQACQWSNQKIGKQIDVHGIVSNGQGWSFYKLDLAGQVYESETYAIARMSDVLGLLQEVFSLCNLAVTKSSI
jgi:hypothetical protein